MVVELGGRWMEMLSLSFGLRFLTVFFNSFSQFDLHRLHNMLTEFCETTLSHCGGRWKVSNLPTMATTTRNYII